MTEQLKSEFKQMRYDILSIVNDLIHQTAADNLPVLPESAPSPEPEPVPYIATNAAVNSNDDIDDIQSEQKLMEYNEVKSENYRTCYYYGGSQQDDSEVLKCVGTQHIILN